MTDADNTRTKVDTPPLSVSAMADTDDADSMVGTAPRRFWVPWARAALDFEHKWEQARDLGIPWETQRWMRKRKKGTGTDAEEETEEETEEVTEEGHGTSPVFSSMRGTSPVP